MRTKRQACRVLIEKGKGNRPFGRSRRRCEGTVKMDLEGIGWYGMAWTCLAEDRDKRARYWVAEKL
jgi:hypothetical protein